MIYFDENPHVVTNSKNDCIAPPKVVVEEVWFTPLFSTVSIDFPSYGLLVLTVNLTLGGVACYREVRTNSCSCYD